MKNHTRARKTLVLLAVILFLGGFICEVLAVYPRLSNTLFNANLATVLDSGYAMFISEIGILLVVAALILAIIGVAIS